MAKTNNKAAVALAIAKKLAIEADGWIDLHNKLFGMGGAISRMFTTESERIAFTKTDECQQVYELFNDVAAQQGDSAAKDFQLKLSRANGAISIRMPRSLHAALLMEADAEGVSLNQLCMAKLMLQLRSLVEQRTC
jgi:predicted HicB family RNase H-like nuclease